MTATHISLLGLMGSGKTTVGERLAGVLQRPFLDVDQCIVETYGPIPHIFATRGESGFRDCEREMLEKLLAAEPSIISPGGGAVTHPPSKELLGRTLRIYLDVPIKTLVKRLRHSSTVRPLVGAKPTAERIQELWDARHALYEEAEIRVSGDAPVDWVVARIMEQLSRRGSLA